MPPTQPRYRAAGPASRPSSVRSAATVSGVAFIPSMYAAGSPGTISMAKKITMLATIRLAPSETRRVRA